MNLPVRFLTILHALGAVALASACSGPGAHRTMEAAISIAFGGALASGLLALIALLLRRKVAAVVCIVLFIIHPAWTMSPYSGDCGGGQFGATCMVAALSLSAFVWDVLKKGRLGS